MKTMVSFLTALLLVCGTQSGVAQTASTPGTTQPSETKAERDARMAWWREARFGLFIHWGLYAIPAGEWNGKTDHGEWILHTAQIPVSEYEKLREQFNPADFNADEWVRMAKDAGMQYIVITSKHHDGFCLFDSQYTDSDVMSTPFLRDIMKELSEACRRGGLRMCWYHSIMDWHHPDYLPRRPWEQRSAEGADFDRYVTHMKNQVRELVKNYGPIGVLWFDGEWENTWTHERGVDLYNTVRSLQPDIIINNRVDKGRNDMQGLTKPGDFVGDFGTPEQEIPPTGLPGVDWETCMTMNDHWGYNKNDHNWKSSTDLIRKLADIASKGGNFLLNVGPMADGKFPPESVERLRDIGRWMKVNGESIHGTQASPFKTLPWGRCTQKPLPDGSTRLYLHVFAWPTDGKLSVPGLANKPGNVFLMSAEPNKDTLAVTRSGDALEVKLPAQAPDAIDSVVVLDIVGRPDVTDAPIISAAADIFVDTLGVSITSERENVELHYTVDGQEPTATAPIVRGPVSISVTATISARAFRDGQPISGVSRASFQKVVPRTAVKIEGLRPGLDYEYFEGQWDKLPDFEQLKPSRTSTVADFSLSPRGRAEDYALRYRGYVSVPRDGVYTFFVRSDDGSRLLIGDQLVVDNDGLHSTLERSGVIALAAGVHPIAVEFFQRTGDVALEVSYAGPGIDRQPIPDGALQHSENATTRPAPGEQAKVPGARPTPQQVAWQDGELGMFIHFAPNTYTDLEYDDLSLPLEKFNPEKLDTEQWVAAAEALGARYIVFVAKHAGGFCLWQTETTDYSVKSTPWRGGKGDILVDLAQSCRKRGIKLGVYVSPADRKHGAGLGGKVGATGPEAYYSPEAGRQGDVARVTPLTQEQYNELYRRQFTEVLTTLNRVLGEPPEGGAWEVWFDGSIMVPVGDILEKYAPRAMIFQGPHTTIRWVGNEDGTAPYPAWNAVSEANAKTGETTAQHGDPNGTVWLPNECDARMRNTWFWNTKNAGTLKTVDQLVDLYYRSVGHGAVLLLNQTPDTTGLIPEADVKRGAEFAAEIERRFGRSVAETNGRGDVVELALANPGPIDHVITMEDIAQGERVRQYVIEGLTDGQWKELARGTAIGHKKIDRVPSTLVAKVRIRVLKSAGEPIIRRLAAFNVGSATP